MVKSSKKSGGAKLENIAVPLGLILAEKSLKALTKEIKSKNKSKTKRSKVTPVKNKTNKSGGGSCGTHPVTGGNSYGTDTDYATVNFNAEGGGIFNDVFGISEEKKVVEAEKQLKNAQQNVVEAKKQLEAAKNAAAKKAAAKKAAANKVTANNASNNAANNAEKAVVNAEKAVVNVVPNATATKDANNTTQTGGKKKKRKQKGGSINDVCLDVYNTHSSSNSASGGKRKYNKKK